MREGACINQRKKNRVNLELAAQRLDNISNRTLFHVYHGDLVDLQALIQGLREGSGARPRQPVLTYFDLTALHA
jgi:hypothetical protein